MAENMQKLALENYTSKLVNKEAELRNIQNQLNEHFLYNTLDSIHWLARSGDNLKVCGMVFALANFYRQSLSSGKEAIPVRDVIEMSKNYLFIQKIRMREALEYNFTCDPGLEGALILKNLIQPIIENAIVHGFRGVNRPGSIDVSFRLQGDGMRIAITDNGVGFEPARLEEVRLELNSPYCEEAFALKTVQSQAQIFYGRPVRLNIETSVGMGTTAWLELPLHPVGG
jgi:two-component system sensor histidine kinase YesM